MSVRSFAVLLAALALAAPSEAQTAGNVVFSGMQVHEIRLQFSQPAFWDSLTTYYTAGNEQYMSATATLDGVAMPSVGVRLKGNSSYGHPNNKKPIRLSFDEYVGSQRWDGLKGVHLNNNFGDPSFLREKLYYDFCRDIGLPAPRASYAAVYLNDSLYGLYTLVEHVDKIFLQTHFGNKNGVHLKAVDAFGQNTTVSDFRWYTSAAPSNYTARYELKSDSTAASWPTLISVIDAANNSGANLPTALGALVDLDAFYRAMAVDHIFANMDSYSASGRNFYVYFNTATGKMAWIPWDAGLSFGGFSAGTTTPEQLPLTYSVSTRPLAYNVFNNAAMRTDYLAATRTVSERFTTARLFPHIDSLVTLIRPYVTADPRKQYTTAQFETNVSSDVTASGGGGSRKPGIKSFITARVSFLRSQFPTAGEDAPALADATLLESAPNPFRGQTRLRYAVQTGGHVALAVYDVLGREVARLVDGDQGAGTYDVTFDAAASGLSSGLYVCRLTAGGTTRTQTVVLQR